MKHFIGMFLLGVFAVTAGEINTNQLSIGGVPVESTVSNGTILGERWMVISNTLIRVQMAVTPISEDLSNSIPNTNQASHDEEPSLRLMLDTWDGPSQIRGPMGLYGLLYMANGLKTPNLSKRTPVDLYATGDKTKIVMMIRTNGPIYVSTNSGVAWTVIRAPGTYEFSLNSGLGRGGFSAEATIYPTRENQFLTNTVASDWYAVGTASDGSKLVLTSSVNQPSAPALSITRNGNNCIISWPESFSGFTLQQNQDLTIANWEDTTNSVQVSNGQNQVIIPLSSANYFFRLKSQSR